MPKERKEFWGQLELNPGPRALQATIKNGTLNESVVHFKLAEFEQKKLVGNSKKLSERFCKSKKVLTVSNNTDTGLNRVCSTTHQSMLFFCSPWCWLHCL